jgi:5-oxoprolinase (ATP-hydrolysing)
VHTHITNTRIGDVEILERRYPVLLHQFALRQGSGGTGKFCGGEGVVRELEVLEPMQVSMLSEVRLLSPFHSIF